MLLFFIIFYVLVFKNVTVIIDAVVGNAKGVFKKQLLYDSLRLDTKQLV